MRNFGFGGLLFFALSAGAPAKEYTLVAAPRGTEAAERALYEPIARLLSAKTGETFRYKFVPDWLSYRSAINDNRYDLYFNGPHFSGWLQDYRGQSLVVALPEQHTFVAIASASDASLNDVSDLRGHKVCVHAPPNLGTLILQSSFTNPSRQPVLVEIQGWRKAYDGVISGRCRGAVLPLVNLKQFDAKAQTKRLIEYPTIPNQGLTASKRMPAELVLAVRKALLSLEGTAAARALLNTYASSGFVESSPTAYTGLSRFLRDDWLLSQAEKPTKLATTAPLPRKKEPMIQTGL